MAYFLGFPALLLAAAAAMSVLVSTAAAVETPSSPEGAFPVCLVGLGAGDGSPPWSQLDVTPNRSIDLDLTDGAGMTVACGTYATQTLRPAAIAPVNPGDPSVKGDFGSL